MTEAIKEALAPRVFGYVVLISLALAFVGAFLATLGVFLLDLSGGAARDTSMVIVVAAFAVSDFWGGSLVAVRGDTSVQQVAIGYTVARAGLLVIATIAFPSLLPLTFAQLLLVAPTAGCGAAVGLRQLQLRQTA